MKDSGVKWLGTIPTHWQVSTIKKHFRIKKNIAGNEGYNVLSITQHGLKVKNVKSNEGQRAQDDSGYQFVNPGDFAMNHMDLITGYVDYSKIYGVTSPDYRVFQLRNDSEDSPEYFLKLLQNCYHRRIFYTFGRGAAEKGRWRLPRENFEAFDIPVPPFEEQEAIADYLKKKCKEIDDLSLKLRKEISLVEEYKTRIISDAVTGKIDLRDIEVPNYEAVEDESATADDENGTEEDLGDDEN
jgi:type I restriction enzyme S subunit